MKKIYALVLAWVGCMAPAWSQSNYSQLTFFGPDSVNAVTVCVGCSTSVYTNTLTTGYSPGETAEVIVDWGDGNIDTATVTFVQQNYYTPSSFSHTYAAQGNYVAQFSFADTNSNADLDTLTMVVSYNCAQVFANVLLDTDADGIGDAPMPGALLDFTGANSVVSSYPVPAGIIPGSSNGLIQGVDMTNSPYLISVNPGWLAANGYIMGTLSPVTQTVLFAGCNNIGDTNPFIVQCDTTVPTAQTDLAINYMYGWGFRAGLSTGLLSVRVCNYSCSGAQNANIAITFDPLLTVFSHNIPGASVSGNTINTNLAVNGCTNYTIYFTVPGPTPAFTPLSFSASVTPVGNTDYDPGNNTGTCASEVRNSWDPNDKTANLPQVLSPNVWDELTYVIRFQNMGNDEAYNIVVKDTLDTDLDLSTFTLLELSHNGSVSVDSATRIATFNFPNIFLPAASVNEPASHGYAIYKIKEDASIPVGTEITNTAYIYFDFNPPIITNTTLNVNLFSGVNETALNAFAVYPVPASEYFWVSSKNNVPLGSIKLMDMTGKTVFAATTAQSTYSVDVKTLANGVYALLLQNGTRLLNQKVIIQK